MNILVVGGGPAGLISAYFLAKSGFNITILEQSDQIGGLLKTTNIGGFEIELVYHHILFNDDYLIKFIDELELSTKLKWYKSSVGIFTHNKYYQISTPFDYILNIDFLDLYERIALIKNLAFPSARCKSLTGLFGEKTYKSFIEDMLINKFGGYADKINSEWFINKLKKRGRSRCVICERLGYIDGSFAIFLKKIIDKIKRFNGNFILNSAIDNIRKIDNQFEVKIGNNRCIFDRIIFTISPLIIAELIDNLDHQYALLLKNLDYMSNITLLLYTKVNPTNYYWINIADRNIKLTGIISQSNLIEYHNSNGYFTYVSIYLPRDSHLFSSENDNILEFILSELQKMKITISKSDLIDYRITKTEYAQPLYITDDDLILNRIATPIEGIYILNNHSILPEDRGLNNIIRLSIELKKMIN